MNAVSKDSILILKRFIQKQELENKNILENQQETLVDSRLDFAVSISPAIVGLALFGQRGIFEKSKKHLIECSGFESLLKSETNENLFKASTLWTVDNWLKLNKNNILKVSWILGRLLISTQHIEQQYKIELKPSSEKIFILIDTLLLSISKENEENPMFVWSLGYILIYLSLKIEKSNSDIKMFDNYFEKILKINENLNVEDSLWSNALILFAVSKMNHNSNFYFRTCSSILKSVNVSIDYDENKFSIKENNIIENNENINIFHLRQPRLPPPSHSNQSQKGFIKGSRNFSKVEQIILKSKFENESKLPLLSKRTNQIVANMPLNDFRCWFLSLITCAAHSSNDIDSMKSFLKALKVDLDDSKINEIDGAVAVSNIYAYLFVNELK